MELPASDPRVVAAVAAHLTAAPAAPGSARRHRADRVSAVRRPQTRTDTATVAPPTFLVPSQPVGTEPVASADQLSVTPPELRRAPNAAGRLTAPGRLDLVRSLQPLPILPRRGHLLHPLALWEDW